MTSQWLSNGKNSLSREALSRFHPTASISAFHCSCWLLTVKVEFKDVVRGGGGRKVIKAAINVRLWQRGKGLVGEILRKEMIQWPGRRYFSSRWSLTNFIKSDFVVRSRKCQAETNTKLWRVFMESRNGALPSTVGQAEVASSPSPFH